MAAWQYVWMRHPALALLAVGVIGGTLACSTSGRSMWSDQVDKAELFERLGPPGPPTMRLSSGAALGSSACAPKVMQEATFTFVPKTRELTWHWTCGSSWDAGTPDGGTASTTVDGKRTLSAAEAESLMQAFRDVEVVGGTLPCDGVSVWAVTHVGSTAALYYDSRDGMCAVPTGASIVTNLAEAMDRAQALALVP